MIGLYKCHILTHLRLNSLTHSLTHSLDHSLTHSLTHQAHWLPTHFSRSNNFLCFTDLQHTRVLFFNIDLSTTPSLDAIFRRIRTTTLFLCFFVRFLPFLLPREDIVRGFSYYAVLYPYHCHYLVFFFFFVRGL